MFKEERLSTRDIAAFLRGRLPAYMVPSRYAVLDEMPKTMNGKIDRARLPKLADLPEQDESSSEASALSV